MNKSVTFLLTSLLMVLGLSACDNSTQTSSVESSTGAPEQSMTDQVANAYLRSQMQGYQDESMEALNKSQEIEDEIKRRRDGKSDEDELTPEVRLMYS